MIGAKKQELLDRAVAAFNRRDISVIAEIMDPDVEAIPLMAQIERTVYRGHAGIQQWYDHLEGHWRDLQAEFREYREGPDGRVVVLGRLWGVGRSSGVEIDAEVGWVAGFREGRIDHLHTYLEPADALTAAGLSRERA